jgi:hypothetical protein
MSVMTLIAGAVLCGISLYRGFAGQAFLGRPLGGDFAQFYVAGRILNEYSGERLYDVDLERKLYAETAPGTPSTHMLVYGNAPYLASLFQPLARLPYEAAFSVWLVISALVYGAGLLLLRPSGMTAEQARMGLLLAFSWVPFLFETWIGGQVSVLGFLALALAVRLDRREAPFLAGLALSLAAFKPPLVLLPVAMLAIGRRWRAVSGVAVGLCLTGGVSFLVAGATGCAGWFDTLRFYREAAMGPLPVLRGEKYVDINAFFRLLAGNGTPVALALTALANAVAFVALVNGWYRSSSTARNWLWAATLVAISVVGIYTPIYDTVVVAAAVAVAAGSSEREQQRRALHQWLVLLYMTPWLTQSIAEHLHVQIFTLVLTGFGYWCLRQASAKVEMPGSA